MALLYFDTSALVKYFHTESGSDVVNAIFRAPGHSFTTSLWTVLEFATALSNKRKAGALSSEGLREAFAAFSDVLDERFSVRELENEYLWKATQLAVKHGLASGDSFHLATLLASRAAAPDELTRLVFICSDARLCEAAEAESVAVLNPVAREASKRIASL